MEQTAGTLDLELEKLLTYADKVLPDRSDRRSSGETAKVARALKRHGQETCQRVIDYVKKDDYSKTHHNCSLSFAFSDKPLEIALRKLGPAAAAGAASSGVLSPNSPEIKRIYDDLMKHFNKIRDYLPENPRHFNCPTLPTHQQLIEQNEYWEKVAREGRRRQAEALEAEKLRREEIAKEHLPNFMRED